MSRNINIKLGSYFEKFIIKQVNSGRYDSVSDVIQAGLRLLEERENKLHTLRAALIAGEKSRFTEYSLEKIISELDDNY